MSPTQGYIFSVISTSYTVEPRYKEVGCITKPSYNKVILLVPALNILCFFYPDIMRNLIQQGNFDGYNEVPLYYAFSFSPWQCYIIVSPFVVIQYDDLFHASYIKHRRHGLHHAVEGIVPLDFWKTAWGWGMWGNGPSAEHGKQKVATYFVSKYQSPKYHHQRFHNGWPWVVYLCLFTKMGYKNILSYCPLTARRALTTVSDVLNRTLNNVNSLLVLRRWYNPCTFITLS